MEMDRTFGTSVHSSMVKPETPSPTRSSTVSVPVSCPNGAVEVMTLIRFVSGAGNRDVTGFCAVSVDQKRERKRADVTAHTGAACDAHDQRESKFIRQIVQIAKSKHQISLLIADDIFGNEIVVPEIFFCLLELNNSDGCLRRSAEELLLCVCSSAARLTA